MSGKKNKKPNIWRKINNLIGTIATQTANDIIGFAKKNNAKVIVFEHLHFKRRKGDKKKKLRAKAQYWTKSRIQKRELERAKVLVKINRTNQTLDTLINLVRRSHQPIKVA